MYDVRTAPQLHIPYAFGHVDMLAPLVVNVGHQREVRLEALLGEEPVDEGVEEALVKVVVDAAAVDALGEKGPEGAPGDLAGRKVSPALYVYARHKKQSTLPQCLCTSMYMYTRLTHLPPPTPEYLLSAPVDKSVTCNCTCKIMCRGYVIVNARFAVIYGSKCPSPRA